MSRESGLHTELTPARPHLAFGPSSDRDDDRHGRNLPAVLIRVPVVRPAVKAARRPSAAATERIRSHRATGRPRRRRLRREFRTALYLVAAFAPFLLAVLLLHGSPASGRTNSGPVAPRAGLVAALRPPVVSITIDPMFSGSPNEPEAPVVLPGYLLPADGAEDSHHAGR